MYDANVLRGKPFINHGVDSVRHFAWVCPLGWMQIITFEHEEEGIPNKVFVLRPEIHQEGPSSRRFVCAQRVRIAYNGEYEVDRKSSRILVKIYDLEYLQLFYGNQGIDEVCQDLHYMRSFEDHLHLVSTTTDGFAAVNSGRLYVITPFMRPLIECRKVWIPEVIKENHSLIVAQMTAASNALRNEGLFFRSPSGSNWFIDEETNMLLLGNFGNVEVMQEDQELFQAQKNFEVLKTGLLCLILLTNIR